MSIMKSGQPALVLRRSSRIRAARQKSNPMGTTTNAATTAESVSTPRDPSPAPPQPEKSLESLTSASQQRSEGKLRTGLTLEESFASQMTLDELPSTAQKVSIRRQHNLTTYKRQRTMRTRSASIVSGRQFASPATIPSSALSQTAPLSQPVPDSTPSTQIIPTSVLGETDREYSELFPSLDRIEHRSTPLGPSDLDPAPSQAVPLSQSSSLRILSLKRRRRLPPLKNRLAKIARARLPRQPSPETLLSQPPVVPPMGQEEEYGEEEIIRDEEEVEEIKPPPVNVTQRRLAAPENFTIPDLKDLIGYKAQAQPPRTPAPRFILPQNTVRPVRSTQGVKSPYKRKSASTPRLKFVALEAHHGQATTRIGNTATKLLPTPQTSPVRKAFVFPQGAKQKTRSRTSRAGEQPESSPCRVLVKATPEIEEPPPKLPSIVDVVSARLTPEPEVEAKPTRSLAPMSELYDNLMKLARSAEQMGRPILPEPSSLKRKIQSTSTPELTFKVTQPTKIARLQ
ncbi:hypothetical protein RHS01_06950 [Rhizoctonia solani]|uniref:Uncharacterized protein n=1 Tax=Rhizoctonia solani TaxID=456999 RepID=A0A8H7I836_9AGAM|nr:hypothetical protein RHS01_06950 [Rhizoctonia solani]